VKTKKPKCSRGGCTKPPKKVGKCWGHYREDLESGQREREALGANPGRLEFEVPRDLMARFRAAVPSGKRGETLRRALEAELQRMKGDS
jgi:hypothetical protein